MEALVLNKSLLGPSTLDIKSPDKEKGFKKKHRFVIFNKAYFSATRINLKICMSINVLVTRGGAFG